MREQEEILNGQVNGKLQDKNEQLMEIQEIEGTPFTLVTSEGKSFVALGRARVTDKHDSKDAAIEEVNTQNWYFMLSVILAIMETRKEIIQAIEAEE